ncbi:MAG: hypothetical protein QOG54_1262 [Actinomycetota bacterium]|jgi:hypothetical protein|nr:hypothetical protein [Actinomycetota bacterium]
MNPDTWRTVLISALALNASLGFGYRVYRLSKGGPMGDVIGQAILGTILAGLAVCLGLGGDWPRWPALVYAVVFGIVVMPVWVLAVLIPLPPERIDYAFTAVYWLSLIAIAVSAIAV